MRVDRVFKGDLKKTIELFEGGLYGGADLQVGKQYVIYASGLQSRAVLRGESNRSGPIEDAAEDLDFLNQYAAGRLTPRIEGTIRFTPGEPEDSDLDGEGRTPMKDVQVTLSSNGRRFQARTDVVGRYSFSQLQPGKYTVDAGLFGFWPESPPDALLLPTNGCVEMDLLMEIDRRVQGFVRDDKDTPVHGALVEMVSTGQLLVQPSQPVVWDVSDENGHYVLHGIPPGDYYLGVSIASTPTKEHPYPPTYYPNSPDPHQTVQIGVGNGASVQTFDLRVPDKLPLVTIRGKVQDANGKPPLVQDHPQVRITQPGKKGQIGGGRIKIESDGRFQFELCEGVKYSAFASSGPLTKVVHSGTVEFTPGRQNDELVLTLDKTTEQARRVFSK